MSPDKPKPGVINALSRILHLHQLPDTPPSTIAPAPTPTIPTPKYSPSDAVPAIPPAYEGKPYVIPEVRRTIPAVSPVTLPPAATAPPVRAEAAIPAPRPAPVTAPPAPRPTVVRPATPAPATHQSVWPFPAPWIKSNTKTAASATLPVPIATPAKPVSPAKLPAPSPARAATPTPKTAIPTPPAMPATPAEATGPNAIVTNFDRILDIVRLQKSIKLDELTKRIGMNEEKIAEELQTLEDNGLIEVRYPAFGEPIIYFKNTS